MLHRLHRPRRSATARRASSSDGVGDVFVIDGMKQADADGPRRRRRQAGRGDPRAGRALRGAAPRRLGSRGAPRRSGARRRRRRGDLPDRRHGCSATTTTSTTRRPASTPTTAGSPSTAAPIPQRLLGVGQTAMRTPEEGIDGPEGDQGARPARRDDARATRPSRTTTRPSTTTSGRRRIELGLPLVVPHPHQHATTSTRSRAGRR